MTPWPGRNRSRGVHVTRNMASSEGVGGAVSSHFLYLGLTFLLLQHLPHCTSYPGVQQTVGQPWPLPQSYKPGTNVQSVNADTFQFRVVVKDCQILRAAFVRYFKLIFRTTADRNAAPLYKDDVLRFQLKAKGEPSVQAWEQENLYEAGEEVGLGSLDVEVGQECAEIGYPSLDMDESCMLTNKYDFCTFNVNFYLNRIEMLRNYPDPEQNETLLYSNLSKQYLDK